MRRLITPILCMLLAMTEAFAQTEVSGIYIGGHIRRERPGTITKLRDSGFTYAILFNVHVDKDGTLMTDGETICKDGVYVFQNTQPYYQKDVANLKAEGSSISRIEICIGGWGNDSYDHIRDLINKEGTSSNTILYRNFKALIEAVPEIDAVNNDDEHCYDADAAAKFHIMMYNLGYKTTLAPYTNKSFWTSLNTKIRASKPKAVDRVMIQCYDGGAGNINSVGSWSFTGVTNRHAGLLNYGNNWDMTKNEAQFQKWYDDGVAVGGFVWVYNDETWDLNTWASMMNRVYKQEVVPEKEVAWRLYSGKNYGGYCVSLPKGSYTMGQLARYGLTANDLESVEMVDDLTQMRIYTNTNCSGTGFKITASRKTLTTSYINKVQSVRIEDNPTAITGIVEDGEIALQLNGEQVLVDNAEGESAAICDLTGKTVAQVRISSQSQAIDLEQLPRGQYIVRVADKTLKVAK